MLHLMSLDKVTEREGRWILQQGYLDDEERIYLEVVSNLAPEGTIARDLTPGRIEIMDDTDGDATILPVEALRDLLTWPPREQS